jgi:hypothetical protein
VLVGEFGGDVIHTFQFDQNVSMWNASLLEFNDVLPIGCLVAKSCAVGNVSDELIKFKLEDPTD